MFADYFDDRRADHHAIGDLRDIGGLFRRAYSKADGDRQIGTRFQPGDGFLYACLCSLLLTGDTGD